MGTDADKPITIHYAETLNWRSLSEPFPWRAEEGKERKQESERIEDMRRIWSTKSTKQGSYGLTDTAAASRGLQGSTPGPLSQCYGCQLGVFVGS